MKKSLKLINILLLLLFVFLISCSDGDDSSSSSSGDGGGGRDNIEGCTDSFACNYDEDATVSDGSCLEYDCNGECGGSLEPDIENACDLPDNTFYILENFIFYNSNVEIAGFQFKIKNATDIIVSDGDANEYFSSIANADNIVIGFDLNGVSIPSGCGILLNIEYIATSNLVKMKDIVVSNPNGDGVDFEYYDCSD